MQGSQAENPGFSNIRVNCYEHLFLLISYWNDKKNCQPTPMIFILHEEKQIIIKQYHIRMLQSYEQLIDNLSTLSEAPLFYYLL